MHPKHHRPDEAATPASAATPARRGLRRGLAAAVTIGLSLLGTALFGVSPAAADSGTAATVVTYDARAAAEFTDAVAAGAQIWNDHVGNVEIRPAQPGEAADVTITATNGWPLTWSYGLGRGRIEMGRQATDEGHDPTRIAAHELGHILGLPDMKPGPCSSLMSGASAGTSCTNAIPNAAEIAEVESNFGFRYSTTDRPLVFQD